MLDPADNLELLYKFCYLGDMLGKGDDAEESSRTGGRCASGKFNELAPILIVRRASMRLKRKKYTRCLFRVF